ncbi:MAG TPA: Gfo/Idh/MocA family oxidoreductase [Leptospiraceae bacterium]|nr:Gfo/Idh/MocA family oxidoreductase [Leptospiraceae bacterium]HMW05895.1 Gfo/Idh/MocA family oxidoreductase [Leptospiraceae bacterium]HMX32673.1 Gfo/Idh/MocA family oxidoreductase [Leptospiraceae bacterium]HMY32740.1 Gfo/Idh/MocA family oxidoreductase [Leptospiraceae bacterium]HMZ62547.1 Gfo/Idh/MocA family oxidoreductase [Leptospiraceae bacterium]
MSDKLKIGIIGVGHMGQYHVNVAKQVQDSTLTGIYDADPERAKVISEKYSVPSFATPEALIEKVDAVVIAAPTFLHHKLSKLALTAGKHVLVEKPIAESVEQARELVKLAEQNKLIFQVGHVERFNGAILELGKIVDTPMLIESRRLAPYNARIKDVGVVLDMMIHDIDIVLNLVDSDVVKVHAVGQKIVSEHEDVATVVLKFANGCVATIAASRNTQAKIRTLNITDKNAYIKLDFGDQEIELHRQASSNTQLSAESIRYKQESIVEKIFVHKDNPLKQEHEHFVKCILGKDSPQVEGEKDIRTLEIAHQILKEISSK